MKIVEDVKEFDEILAANKSVFVDFYADWCGPCKMVSPVVEELSAKYPEIVFVKVNVDDNPDIAQRFGVMSIPALFAFKDGEVSGSTVGFQPAPALERVIQTAQ